MTQEKETFVPSVELPSSKETTQGELQLDGEEVYKKVLQICSLEEERNEYGEHTYKLLMTNFRNIKGLVDSREEDMIIEGFGFLRHPDSKDIEIMLLLSNLSERDQQGDDVLEILDVYKNYVGKVRKGFRPQEHLTLKVDEIDSTQDFFFTFYPVYLQVSDPERIAQIEDMLERMDWRELIMVEEREE